MEIWRLEHMALITSVKLPSNVSFGWFCFPSSSLTFKNVDNHPGRYYWKTTMGKNLGTKTPTAKTGIVPFHAAATATRCFLHDVVRSERGASGAAVSPPTPKTHAASTPKPRTLHHPGQIGHHRRHPLSTSATHVGNKAEKMRERVFVYERG